MLAETFQPALPQRLPVDGPPGLARPMSPRRREQDADICAPDTKNSASSAAAVQTESQPVQSAQFQLTLRPVS